MPRLALTQKTIEATPLPVSCKSVDYFDQRMPGLVLRVSAGGTRSWNTIYRHEGRVRRLTLGRYPIISLEDARMRAREVLCEVTRGKDPALKPQTDDPTFRELARDRHANALENGS
jgi:hypothetical protein